ncbi:ATP-binding protein [Streptomyces sp. H10-C2]|uniref:ATP-binding protein n=1 Tax=unclassified Streptomyces TaxID=2593676 RepID=UPI0024B8C1B9|nr:MULTISPECIES: ATP-binding protein [unclassified Streptomyces]MDJ0342087.1 ATP-binding protein [Streptomyces sp. PH10-H1]MDJ0368429.1 ATP-binding protein [Streptomyces sp. H10-C2]
MALVVAQEVPTSSTMALSHGPMGVAEARRRLREELYAHEVPEPVVDDAVLILSELLSNSYRHARPLCDGPEETGPSADAADACGIRAAWRIGDDDLLTVEVTDGGGPTRPLPSSPSLTARGGRGLGIVNNLSLRWGVRDSPGEVTVWALLPVRSRHARRDDLAPRLDIPIDFADPFDDLP